MKEGEKNSREQPKEELWIHGRAYLWAMDMPQSKRNENRYFWSVMGDERVVNRLGGVSDLIRSAGQWVRPRFAE
jgi:hypothetical protein